MFFKRFYFFLERFLHIWASSFVKEVCTPLQKTTNSRIRQVDV